MPDPIFSTPTNEVDQLISANLGTAAPATSITPPYSDRTREAAFQSWYQEMAQIAQIDPDPDDPKHKYDYRRAFENGVKPKYNREDGRFHWDSRFKLSDHPNRFVEGRDTITGEEITPAESVPAPGIFAPTKEEFLSEQVPEAPSFLQQSVFAKEVSLGPPQEGTQESDENVHVPKELELSADDRSFMGRLFQPTRNMIYGAIDGLRTGFVQNKVLKLRWEELSRDLTPEQEAQIDSEINRLNSTLDTPSQEELEADRKNEQLRKSSAKGFGLTSMGRFGTEVGQASGELFPNMARVGIKGAAGGVLGAGMGTLAAVGAGEPHLIPIAARQGAQILSTVYAWDESRKMEAAGFYDEIKQLEQGSGTKIDPAIVKTTSHLVGVLNATLEIASLRTILGLGTSPLKVSATKIFADQAFMKIIGKFASNPTTEALTELEQESISYLGKYVANELVKAQGEAGFDADVEDANKLSARLMEVFKKTWQGTMGTGLISVVGPVSKSVDRVITEQTTVRSGSLVKDAALDYYRLAPEQNLSRRNVKGLLFLNNPEMNTDEIADSMKVFDLYAKNQGMSTDEFLQKNFHRESFTPAQTVPPPIPSEAKKAPTFEMEMPAEAAFSEKTHRIEAISEDAPGVFALRFQEALDLEKQGVPARTILMKTGFKQKSQGEWIFVVSDADLSPKVVELISTRTGEGQRITLEIARRYGLPQDLGPNAIVAELGTLVDHPIFKQFPQLAQVPVVIDSNIKLGSADAQVQGFADNSPHLILGERFWESLGSTTDKKGYAKKIFAHEMQHIVDGMFKQYSFFDMVRERDQTPSFFGYEKQREGYDLVAAEIEKVLPIMQTVNKEARERVTPLNFVLKDGVLTVDLAHPTRVGNKDVIQINVSPEQIRLGLPRTAAKKLRATGRLSIFDKQVLDERVSKLGSEILQMEKARGEADYVRYRMTPSERTAFQTEQMKDENLQRLFLAKRAAEVRGSVQFMQDGKALLRLFQNSDVDVLMHEFAHVMMKYLTPEQTVLLSAYSDVAIDHIEKFQQDPNSLSAEEFEQVRKAQEKFAQGFEKYLKDGKAPNEGIKNLFGRMQKYLRDLYEVAKVKHLEGVEIPKEARKLYDSLLVLPEEKNNGQIVTPKKKYRIFPLEVGGKVLPVIRVPGGVLTVENLVQGKEPNSEQIKHLGKDIIWRSPYEQVFAEQMALEITEELTQQWDISRAEKMTRKQLDAFARKLGIKNPGKEERTRLLFLMQEAIKNKDVDPDERLLGHPEESGFWEAWLAPEIRAIRSPEGNIIYEGTEAYMLPIVDRIKSGTPTEYKTKLYHKCMDALDAIHKIYGGLQTYVRRVQKLSQSNLFYGEKKDARNILNQVQWTSSGAGYTMFQHLAENVREISSQSKMVQDIISAWQDLVRVTGTMAEKAGLLIHKVSVEDGKRTVSQIPFRAAADGAKFLRQMTSEFWDILLMDDDSLRRELSRVIAMENSGTWNEQTVFKQLQTLHQRANTRFMSLEVMRAFEKMPVWVRLNYKGQEIKVQIMHNDPYFMSDGFAEQFSKRLGFVQHFGQDRKAIEKLEREYVSIGKGKAKDFDYLMRALNGIPVLDGGRYPPGSFGANARKWMKGTINLFKSSVLGLAWTLNFFETIAKTPVYGGVPNFNKVLGKLFYAAFVSGKNQDLAAFKELAAFAKRAGALSTGVSHFIVRPSITQAFYDLADITSRTLLSATFLRQVNSWNEYFSALVGDQFALQLLDGDGTYNDRQKLKALKFSPEQIETLMSSRVRLGLHDQLINRMVRQTQGTGLTPAEMPLFANWTNAKYLIAFDSYFRLTAMRFYEAAREVYRLRSFNTKEDFVGQRKAAWRIFGGLVLGHTISGSLGYGLRQLVRHGPAAFTLADWDEDDDGTLDDWMKFFAKGFYFAVLGGPADFILRQTFDRGSPDIRDNMIEATVPGAILGGISDFWTGKGKYKDMPFLSRTGKFLWEFSNAVPAITTWASTIGLGSDDPELDLAIKKYYAWRRKNEPWEESTTYREDILTKRFRYHMRNATKLMGDRPGLFATQESINASANEELQKAIQLGVEQGKTKEEAVKSVRNSLLNRRLLRLSPNMSEKSVDRLLKLKAAIGEEAYEKLIEYDNVLNWWANS